MRFTTVIGSVEETLEITPQEINILRNTNKQLFREVTLFIDKFMGKRDEDTGKTVERKENPHLKELTPFPITIPVPGNPAEALDLGTVYLRTQVRGIRIPKNMRVVPMLTMSDEVTILTSLVFESGREVHEET